jgi:hypothetical protein
MLLSASLKLLPGVAITAVGFTFSQDAGAFTGVGLKSSVGVPVGLRLFFVSAP